MRWDDAVADGLTDEKPGQTLEELIAWEQESLWHDLSDAMAEAIRGAWSMRCDWIVTRIVRLARVTGATRWGALPTTLIYDGTWAGICAAAGIAHVPPTARELAGMQRLEAKQRAAAAGRPRAAKPPVLPGWERDLLERQERGEQRPS